MGKTQFGAIPREPVKSLNTQFKRHRRSQSAEIQILIGIVWNWDRVQTPWVWPFFLESERKR